MVVTHSGKGEAVADMFFGFFSPTDPGCERKRKGRKREFFLYWRDFCQRQLPPNHTPKHAFRRIEKKESQAKGKKEKFCDEVVKGDHLLLTVEKGKKTAKKGFLEPLLVLEVLHPEGLGDQGLCLGGTLAALILLHLRAVELPLLLLGLVAGGQDVVHLLLGLNLLELPLLCEHVHLHGKVVDGGELGGASCDLVGPGGDSGPLTDGRVSRFHVDGRDDVAGLALAVHGHGPGNPVLGGLLLILQNLVEGSNTLGLLELDGVVGLGVNIVEDEAGRLSSVLLSKELVLIADLKATKKKMHKIEKRVQVKQQGEARWTSTNSLNSS